MSRHICIMKNPISYISFLTPLNSCLWQHEEIIVLILLSSYQKDRVRNGMASSNTYFLNQDSKTFRQSNFINLMQSVQCKFLQRRLKHFSSCNADVINNGVAIIYVLKVFLVCYACVLNKAFSPFVTSAYSFSCLLRSGVHLTMITI